MVHMCDEIFTETNMKFLMSLSGIRYMPTVVSKLVNFAYLCRFLNVRKSILMHTCTYIHKARAKCRGLLLACCSCAVACGPVCRTDRWSFTASPGLSVEFTGRGRQFIRTQHRERENVKERSGDREKGIEGQSCACVCGEGASLKTEG